jgi:hypothetical protein
VSARKKMALGTDWKRDDVIIRVFSFTARCNIFSFILNIKEDSFNQSLALLCLTRFLFLFLFFELQSRSIKVDGPNRRCWPTKNQIKITDGVSWLSRENFWKFLGNI